MSGIGVYGPTPPPEFDPDGVPSPDGGRVEGPAPPPAAPIDLRSSGARMGVLAGITPGGGIAGLPAGDGSFAARMAERYADRPKLDLDEAGAATRGAGGAWNHAMKELANANPRLQQHAEKELTKQFTKLLVDAQSPEGYQLSEAELESISKELVSQLMQARIGGVSAESLIQGTELLLRDMTLAIGSGLLFQKAQDDVRAEARRSGGLAPGQDVELNETLGKPLAAEAKAARDRLKTKAYFKPGIKLDLKKLAGKVDEVLKEVRADVGFKFEKGDFKANVGVDMRVEGPLTPGARAVIRGHAEMERGSFRAAVEGTATVENVFTDPRLGPSVDLGVSLGYRDPRVSAALRGSVSVPTSGPMDPSWKVGAEAAYDVNDRVRLGATGFVGGGGGQPTGLGGMVTLGVVF